MDYSITFSSASSMRTQILPVPRRLFQWAYRWKRIPRILLRAIQNSYTSIVAYLVHPCMLCSARNLTLPSQSPSFVNTSRTPPRSISMLLDTSSGISATPLRFDSVWDTTKLEAINLLVILTQTLPVMSIIRCSSLAGSTVLLRP